MVVRRHGEGQTGGGQLVRFTTGDDGVDEAKAALRDHFHRIELPVTHKTNVEHGGYGRYSRFDIEKVEYWAGHHGYYEILDIKDAPDGHHPYVSHSYNGESPEGIPLSYFVEWESIEAAQASLKTVGAPVFPDAFRDPEKPVPGVKRVVEVNLLSPWFYATGDAEITGDYVFPERLANDPVYTLGRQFLVPVQQKWLNEVDHMALKTAMGAIVQEVDPEEELRRNGLGRYAADDRDKNPYFVKTIQWADGSISRVSDRTPYSLMPRAVDGEPWIAEAVGKIQLMLSGQALDFTVNFADGGKFVGKFIEPKGTESNVEGDYLLSISFADGTEQRGWVYGFKPGEKTASVTEAALKAYEKLGKEVSHIEILQRQTKGGGKKWKGIYYNRASHPEQIPEETAEVRDL